MALLCLQKTKKTVTFGNVDDTIEFNFHESLIWVSIVKNNFYAGGKDSPRVTVNIFKLKPDGFEDKYNPVARYSGGTFKAISFVPEPNTAYYAEVSALVSAGKFFGGNYAIKISDAPLDVNAGVSLQDGSRADDDAGRKQNDSHEHDEWHYTARLKPNAWNNIYAGNLVSPGTYYGSQIPDKDCYWFRPPSVSTPLKTLNAPNKPIVTAGSKSLEVEWNEVSDARYYLVVLYDSSDKIVGIKPHFGKKYKINGTSPDETYKATVVAMGNLVDENDSPESEKSDGVKPLP